MSMIPHSPVPLARLDELEVHEVCLLNAELARVQRQLARLSADRDVVHARVTLFLHGLKKKYHLESTAAVIDGDCLYEIELESLL